MNEWQSIETAPKDGTPVLLFCERTFIGKAYWFSNTLEWWGCSYPDNPEASDPEWEEISPTHWMPEPEPPNEQ